MQTWSYLKIFINNVIGTYTPIELANGNIALDVPFVIAGILFLLIVHWFFKIIYAIFR